ncbi:MAG: sigma-54 dependent transcriptional regulator [Myxococcota bacterium]|nr:sigma-54 dependent transcriptional regulator [Myxococcota bacterium]
MSPRILVVEDEQAIRLALRGLLSREGYEVALAEDGERAIARLASEEFDLVLTDLALGRGVSGMDVLQHFKEQCPGTAVVMITAHGSEKIAVDAMKAGADDYVPKPFDNDEIRVVVRRALNRYRLERENRLLLERIQRDYGFDTLIGSGEAMQNVFETIQKVAETDLTVLVRGESGTGKELVAQALHNSSNRKQRPFIAVNCAAINRELVESELFGHEKGAFTGADSRRAGRFESAEGGTIFLDEVGDMAPETQAKVLRVLQERKLERVGGTSSVEVDVRVVVATHRDLEKAVEEGTFREDLYYRLKVVEVELPPLRERRADVAALADRFLGQVAERLGRDKKRLSDDSLTQLARHTWPGNVRELRNVIEQAAVLSSGDSITAGDLKLDDARQADVGAVIDTAIPFSESKKRHVDDFERSYLLRALRENGGNVSRTANAIGMVRQSLQQKIRELELRSEDWGNGDKS